MPGNPREIVTMAERRFPVRIRIGVPPSGFGQRYTEITESLDGNCGADGWAITPSGMRGVLNDAVSIYFRGATLGARLSPAGARFVRGSAAVGGFRTFAGTRSGDKVAPLTDPHFSRMLTCAPRLKEGSGFRPRRSQ
jgi:hypothetical protein